MLLYNMPGMLALGAELETLSANLRGVGENINRISQDISMIWEGQAALNYQAWQASFLVNMETMNSALDAMAGSFIANSVTMNATDAAFAATWV